MKWHEHAVKTEGLRTHGFTLIELSIWVIIVGVLMAGAFAMINTMRRRINMSRTQTLLRTTNQAILMFHDATQTYPVSLHDLKFPPADPKIRARWGEPFMAFDGDEPEDSWGAALVYHLKPKGSKPPYELYSWGPEGDGSPQEGWVTTEVG